MSCRAWRVAIDAAAAEGAPTARLSTHLESCAGCRALLQDRQQRLALLDTDLRDALSIEPSADLVERALQAAAGSETARGPSRMPLAAAAVLALLVLGLLARRGTDPTPERGASAIATPQPSPGEQGEATPPARARPARVERFERPVRLRATLPRPSEPAAAAVARDVLVPAADQEALRLFVQAHRDQSLGDVSVLSAPADAAGPSEIPRPRAFAELPRPVEIERGQMENVRSLPSVQGHF